jgi:hypothetical protein
MSDTMKITEPQKTIVFCLPGNMYSKDFLISWSQVMIECVKRNINCVMAQGYASCVHFARAKVLGGNVLAGKNQAPFQGAVPYDYLMWIDSDIVFTPEDVFKLVDSPHDITCGLYIMEDGKNFPIVRKYDDEFFLKNGHYQMISGEEMMTEKERYINVDYSGMGWMCIKKGVVEKIQYPWFFHDKICLTDNIHDMCSEDVSFCKNLKHAGFDIYVDTTVVVGHQKLMTLGMNKKK